MAELYPPAEVSARLQVSAASRRAGRAGSSAHRAPWHTRRSAHRAFS